MKPELKFVTGTVRSLDRAAAEETRTVEFVISDESRDRHRTVIPIANWRVDNYNRNGIVGYQHDVYGDSFMLKPDPDDVIGIGRAYVDGNQLIGVVTFEPAEINPKAEKIFRKVLNGSLKATSVGFIENSPGIYIDNDPAFGGKRTYYFGETELLEFSIVNIPSNANAIRRSNGGEDNTLEIARLTAENEQLKSIIETKNETNRLQTLLIETLNNKLDAANLDIKYFKNKAFEANK